MSQPLRVGLIGCGVISSTYLGNAARFSAFDVVACADLDQARAARQAAEYGTALATVEALLADPAIDCVLDLTPPAAHHAVGRAAIAAGKHLYQEKPLTTGLDDARALLEAAGRAGVRIGCAPDTFLGAGLQTVRRLVDEGTIGTPVAAAFTMLNGGPERWHPEPAFFYAPGAGPLFDVGPYHVTAAIALLGAVRAVSGAARRSTPSRLIASGPSAGTSFPVEVDTTVSALLEHESGALVTLTTSFDAPARARLPFELHGTEGSIEGPDPNEFGGPVTVRSGDGSREPAALVAGPADNARGIGLDDFARAIAEERPHRASGELALHVLEIMHGILVSAHTGSRMAIESRAGRPEPYTPNGA